MAHLRAAADLSVPDEITSNLRERERVTETQRQREGGQGEIERKKKMRDRQTRKERGWSNKEINNLCEGKGKARGGMRKRWIGKSIQRDQETKKNRILFKYNCKL